VTGAKEPPSIWWWAFGYFATYVPYAALTKVLTTEGMIDTGGRLDGMELLPPSVMATVLTSITFLWLTGWWRHAVRPGERIPRPTWFTALSGICSGGIIATTTLAYTFGAAGIVLVMLLLRGGLLILAPLVDVMGGRKIRWFSLAALVLSIASLCTALIGGSSTEISVTLGIDVGLYLLCYFIRLQIMSSKAKSKDPATNMRYFVEEQLVSSPSLLIALTVWALIGWGGAADHLRDGFSSFFDRPIALLGLLVGVLSQGTGIFGGLILLDRRENTFSVPVNRASSVLAGVVASISLWVLLDAKAPRGVDLVGATIMISAILVLSVGAAYDRGRAQRAAPPTTPRSSA